MPLIAPVADRKDREAVRTQNKQRLGWGEELVADGGVSALACRVGMILMFKFDGTTGQVSLANSTLARMVGRSGRQVQTAKAELVERNYLNIKYNRRDYAIYRLIVDEPRAVGEVVYCGQDRKQSSDLSGDLEEKPASDLDNQDARKISTLTDNIHDFGAGAGQGRKFSAVRPEENFIHYTVDNPCFPSKFPQSAHERSGVGLAAEARTPCVGGQFQTAEAAIEAVIQVAQLSSDDAAMLRAFRFDPAAQRLIARTETALIAIRTRAGPALEQLGLQTACGAIG